MNPVIIAQMVLYNASHTLCMHHAYACTNRMSCDSIQPMKLHTLQKTLTSRICGQPSELCNFIGQMQLCNIIHIICYFRVAKAQRKEPIPTTIDYIFWFYANYCLDCQVLHNNTWPPKLSRATKDTPPNLVHSLTHTHKHTQSKTVLYNHINSLVPHCTTRDDYLRGQNPIKRTGVM